ncbi:MAG: hypothetical protein M1823_006142 [Watsoniomyces obsoletus]|nr:MAG: hypothetical protein M1823_006142 [Watsoniomyces obsoletus]
MVVESLRSPTVIPPRTSSSSHTNGHSHGHQRTPSRGATKALSTSAPPETAWMAPSKRTQHHHLHHPSNSIMMSGNGPPPPMVDGGSDPVHRINDDLIYQTDSSWSEEKEKILQGPFDYLFAHPGKDIRSQLIAAFNAWLHVPSESLAVITKVVGMLHTASLLIDDVEDSSVLRRGIPVAHSIFGVAQTLNSSNYVYFCALRELLQLHNPRAIEIYTEELVNLHRGQGMDLFWRDTLTCPTEDDYLEMVGNKTGGLFRLAIKLMQAESNSDK